jgi:hypothetical protein
LQRRATDREPGTGAQRAHGGSAAPQLVARFARLHLQVGMALRLVAVAISVLARHVERFEGRQLCAVRQQRPRTGGHRLSRLVIVAQHRAGTGATHESKRLDGDTLYYVLYKQFANLFQIQILTMELNFFIIFRRENKLTFCTISFIS